MNFESLFSISPLSWACIGAALVSGTIVGLERQLRGKPVGITTSVLIVLGTYMFITLSNLMINDSTDPSRIIGQVVTGIGFLGAGVMLSKEGVVVGVTSAATIWALAAIGVSIPIVGEVLAIKMSIVVVLILCGVDILEGYSAIFTRGAHSKFNKLKRKA